MMRKSTIKKISSSLMALGMAILLTSALPGDEVMTREGKTYVVNTTTLAADVEGYQSPTPLKIYITNGKIEKVEALRNNETPKYFAMIKKQLLDKWNGMTAKKAASAKVDAVTGATMSSKAVMENVKRGVQYYQKHKK